MNRTVLSVFLVQSLTLIFVTQCDAASVDRILNWKRGTTNKESADVYSFEDKEHGKLEKLRENPAEMEYLELIDFFSWLDLNKDGFLTQSEVTLVEKFTEPRVDWERLKPYERSGDGKLDLDEFLKAFLREGKPQVPSLEEILEVFGMFDADKDGLIRPDEIKETMEVILGKKLTAEHVRDILREVDTNKSGSIDLNEFAMSISIVE